MIILVDLREKKQCKFSKPSETATLPPGDYSISGGQHLITIERKTADDLIKCLARHRGRALQYFALVVESSLLELSNGHYMSLMKPKAAIQSLLTFSIRYGLPIFFVENREYGARVCHSSGLKERQDILRADHQNDEPSPFPYRSKGPQNFRELLDNMQLSFLQTAEFVARNALREGMKKDMFYLDIYSFARDKVTDFAATVCQMVTEILPEHSGVVTVWIPY